jgi:hypothetical protein
MIMQKQLPTAPNYLTKVNNGAKPQRGIADTGTTDTLFKHEDRHSIIKTKTNKTIHVELPLALNPMEKRKHTSETLK